MNLQVIMRTPYTFLPSGILIVEPHEGLLAARTMLLAAADYYVGVSDPGKAEDEETLGDGYEVAVAILSESLGNPLLGATAHAIRRRWPHARILIFGRTTAAIEDNLYDARIDHQARPEELLSALVGLSEDLWNQRARPPRLLKNDRSWLPGDKLEVIAESDPTKRQANATEMSYGRDMPSGERTFSRAP